MKSDSRFSPERVASIKKRMPKGASKIADMPPIKGLDVKPLTWSDLGLKQKEERKAA